MLYSISQSCKWTFERLDKRDYVRFCVDAQIFSVNTESDVIKLSLGAFLHRKALPPKTISVESISSSINMISISKNR